MIHRQLVLSSSVLAVLVAVSCAPPQATPSPTAGIPNPASVFCEENGGKLELRQDASGAVAGICVFPDGSECDEWRFFRGDCKPGDSLAAVVEPSASETSPQSASPSASEDWKTYRNEQLGFSFQYPAQASITPNDDPQSGLSVVGPLVGDDYWPMFYVSHPLDREEYRPPTGADLDQWLTEHNLIGAERLPDVQIAGTTAIHMRHKRSPQSFAFDTYYFAKSGQLYSIVIQHTGDREDWTLYSKFLDSFQFDR